ncbi:dual specificity phosphatase 11 (RNA RNP complex 1-interacting) [Pristimantis euphronides]
MLRELGVSCFRVLILRHIHLQCPAMGYKDGVPDRWTKYIPVGKRIPGTRFIAFKVPLKNMYDDKLLPKQRFSAADLIKEVKKQKEELGLIVDLTCTMRYYSPQELPKTIKYSKIFTVGQQVPSDKVIANFKNIVKQYLSQNAKNDKLVGVHCTHGLNRTGYLVCRYLIDLLGMDPSEAIEKFNSSRGHTMERGNYINDLLHGKSRSNGKLDTPQAKQQPSGKNIKSGPPPHSREQPQSHSYNYDTPRGGQRFPGPSSVQSSLHQKPGQVMGPRHGMPHSGGKYPSHGPRILPAGLQHPHMSGPRHSFPQMEGNQASYFRGQNKKWQHPQRPFPQHHDRANGAALQHGRPRFTPQSDYNPGKSFPARPPHSRQPGNNKPYQRDAKPVNKKIVWTEWQ